MTVLNHHMTQDPYKSWIGLDLFNDDTRPSGHISRPTQVNVSQSCFNSLNKLLKLNYIVQVWGLAEVHCVISDRRIPLLAGIPLCMSREMSRRGYSMNQLCSIRHDIPAPLHTPGAYGQCWVWPQWWQAVGGPQGKIWDLVALVWPIRSRVITTSSALVKRWNFFGCSNVGFTR